MNDMKKAILLSSLLLTIGSVQAQSLSDLFSKESLNKVVNSVMGKEDKPNLTGTWSYAGSACEFESENLLKKAGGSVAAAAVEKELDAQCAKIGIVPGKFGFTFNADSTFVNTYGKKRYKGTYSYNAATGKVELKYLKLIGMNAKAETSGSTLNLTFKADTLLKLLSFLGSKSSSSITKTAASLADGYDGMLLGFEMKKK